MERRYLLCLGLLLLIAAGGWKWLMAPRFTIRLPADWSFHAQYLGNLVYADARGNLPRQRRLNLYQRDIHPLNWQQDKAVLQDSYRTIDVETGEVTWESQLRFEIDPASGKILNYANHPEARGRFYLFPQGATKTDYPFFSYDLAPITMRFHREEMIDSVPLNVYRFQGQLDYTELYRDAYIGAIEAPGVTGEARIVTYHLFRELWVEPVTGEVVHIVEDDPGDYLVHPTTGEPGRILCVWAAKSTGRTMKFLLEQARERQWQLRLHRQLIPGLLLGGALFCLGVGLGVPGRARRLLLRSGRDDGC